MQNDLSSRMEKLWAMAEIAQRHGTADYGFDGHSKAVRLAGLSFFYLDGILARVCGSKMNISITRNSASGENVVLFPGLETLIQFISGSDETLDYSHNELQMLDDILTPRATHIVKKVA